MSGHLVSMISITIITVGYWLKRAEFTPCTKVLRLAVGQMSVVGYKCSVKEYHCIYMFHLFSI
jgi:hypothetical protein